jgi:hypothetical protein
MRNISPFISALLIVLVLSGSMGFTLIKHTCYHCGVQEISASVTSPTPDKDCCCGHDAVGVMHCHSTDEMIFSDDCCTHETERVVTDELVRTDERPDVIPFFTVAVIIGFIPVQNYVPVRSYADDLRWNCSSDLTTLYCRINS